MTSLSYDPFRFPFRTNAKFIGYVEPSGEGRLLVFPRLICGFHLQGESPRLAGYLKIFLYILRSLYANEAEGPEYNEKQWKSFEHELLLGKLGDRPETFRRRSPICLDGGRLGRFFFQIFFAEKIDFF